MSALSPDEPPSAAKREVTPQGVPQKKVRSAGKRVFGQSGQALKPFFIARTKHAVPEIELRRSRYGDQTVPPADG